MFGSDIRCIYVSVSIGCTLGGGGGGGGGGGLK